MTSKMRLTMERGADFWNDSCALNELGEAVASPVARARGGGAAGASVVKTGQSDGAVTSSRAGRVSHPSR